MSRKIDDKDLENIAGAGGSTTPEETSSGKPGEPPVILPDPPGSGGNTGTGDVEGTGGAGDGGVNQG